MLEVLSVIDKHGVQGILKLIFTNTFKNRSLWSVTSTLVPFDSFAGIGLTLQTMTKFAYYFEVCLESSTRGLATVEPVTSTTIVLLKYRKVENYM